MFNIKATGKENLKGTHFHFFFTEFLFVDSLSLYFYLYFPCSSYLLFILLKHKVDGEIFSFKILRKGA